MLQLLNNQLLVLMLPFQLQKLIHQQMQHRLLKDLWRDLREFREQRDHQDNKDQEDLKDNQVEMDVMAIEMGHRDLYLYIYYFYEERSVRSRQGPRERPPLCPMPLKVRACRQPPECPPSRTLLCCATFYLSTCYASPSLAPCPVHDATLGRLWQARCCSILASRS